MERPEYFERIHTLADDRWNQLESDPDLAGPWHQLFKQVQSPRHVVSELLQNADDAFATYASVSVEDGIFRFEHTGEDFTREHFTSLCRFGYSNKKALHTIGFRGIGFKSTFSLGDRVELFTPTLAVAFERDRFTQPIWIGGNYTNNNGQTEIRVALKDQYRQVELEKNIAEWKESPISLLFFRHLRRILFQNEELGWQHLRPGPVPNSEWLTLTGDEAGSVLLIRSEPEDFPDEAIEEIKQERMIAEGEIDFPSCQVEIVLGTTGKLYVVLPTGVSTNLPFACNAPFIQDPARLKIKDPETSPTNRWLLQCTGKLAGNAMLQWLNRNDLSMVDRCRAYGLFAAVDINDNSLEGTCAAIVQSAFDKILESKSILLTDDGDLRLRKECIIIPKGIAQVWSSMRSAELFDLDKRPAFSMEVSSSDRKRLVERRMTDELDRDQVIRTLCGERLPKPDSWEQLLHLWEYVAPEITNRWYTSTAECIRIMPVQGKNDLYSAQEIVRLGEKRLLQTEADWQFLSKYLLVLNQNWPRFLAEKKRRVQESGDINAISALRAADDILRSAKLQETSDVSDVIEQVSFQFFFQERVDIASAVQLTQIAAKLGATVGQAFHYFTQDGQMRPISEGLLIDQKGRLLTLLPKNWQQQCLVHPAYVENFRSCTGDEWLRWISSGRSGLSTCVLPVQTEKHFWNHESIVKALEEHGYSGPFEPRYSRPSFELNDWDFPEDVWSYWESSDDEDTWGVIMEALFEQPPDALSKVLSANVREFSSNGRARTVISKNLMPTWIIRLREKECLPDTRGRLRQPLELLLRTPDTEALIDVEPFLDRRLDTEANRPLLLLLGVRDTPTGPDRILDYLRSLSKSNEPPIYEVEKWYRLLDQLSQACSTEDFKKVKRAFSEEKLILSEDVTWTNAASVFLYSDEETIPGLAVIRTSVRDLSLWPRINVAQRPTADLIVAWLKELPSGQPLSSDEVQRVRAVLPRQASRIWYDCKHWLNLAGQWVPVETLRYRLSMQSLVQWSHLHEWVKEATADLQSLPREIIDAPPFNQLSALAEILEKRFENQPETIGQPERKAWLNQLGLELCRIEFNDETETDRVRDLAARLVRTTWLTTPGIDVIPYIDGMPAGIARQVEVLWQDTQLFVVDRPMAKLAFAVARELGSVFNDRISDAIKICFERAPDFVTEYMEENFKLASRQSIRPSVEPGDQAQEAKADAEKAPKFKESTTDTVEADTTVDTKADIPEVSGLTGEIVPEKDDRTNGDTEDNKAEAGTQRFEQRPAKPLLIERFALSQGFRKDGDGRFLHTNGSWLAKTSGSAFPWERRSAAGEIICFYWLRDHCLELEPLQIPADIWGLLKEHPELYAMILVAPSGQPVELSGDRLQKLTSEGEIKLYPATYRLVYQNGR